MMLRARIRSAIRRFRWWLFPPAVWTGCARNGCRDDPDNWRKGRVLRDGGEVVFPTGACYDPPPQLGDGPLLTLKALWIHPGTKIGISLPHAAYDRFVNKHTSRPMVTTTYAQGPRQAPRGDAREEGDR